MKYFILFTIFLIYIINKFSSYFTLIFRLLKKCFKKSNNYIVPKLNPYDYNIPPFPNTWYPICLSSELKKNMLQKKKIAGKEFILFRDNNGLVSAINKNCSHMGVDLSYAKVNNNCVVCPFHHQCVKSKTYTNNPDEKIYFIEETNNIIFIWNGELIDGKPFFSIKDLIKNYDVPKGDKYFFKCFSRNVGGHLLDYAEHLLDINHAPYIHGVHLQPVENSMVLDKYSFTIKFKIEETNVKPIFTYITPTFGVIEYSKDVKIFMMFIVYDVGNIDMVILPCGQNLLELFYSSLGALYTQIDFADEAAYFSTKDHNIRNLLDSEKAMDDFRKWFIDTFYTKNQLIKFNENKKKHNEMKIIHDW